MRNKILGFGFGLLANFFMVFTGVVVKWVDQEIPTAQLLFIRFLVGFLIMLPIVIKKEGGLKWTTTPWRKHLLRAVLGLVAIFSFYYAIPKVNFVDYVVLGRLYPFLMIVFGYMFLKEKAGPTKVVAALLAIVGALIMVRPDLNSEGLFLLMIVLGIAIAAVSDIVVKKLTATESCEKIILCFFGMAAIILGCFMPFLWKTPASGSLLLSLLIIAGTGLLTQFFMTKAYAVLNAGTVGLVSSTQLIWAVCFGAGLWSETMGLHTWVGIGVIFISSFLGMFRFSGRKKSKVRGLPLPISSSSLPMWRSMRK